MSSFEFRKIERKGFCRVCDKLLEKGEEIFYTYSNRNRGQAIPICMGCIDEISCSFIDGLELGLFDCFKQVNK